MKKLNLGDLVVHRGAVDGAPRMVVINLEEPDFVYASWQMLNGDIRVERCALHEVRRCVLQ